jgi:hypothetical protein
LSVIASQPNLIANLFVTKTTTKDGKYTLRFYRGEQWQNVTVDSYFPCFIQHPYFADQVNPSTTNDLFQGMFPSTPEQGFVYSRSKQGDLWVCLLEKAYAKLTKSYQALTSGTFSESLRVFLVILQLTLGFDRKASSGIFFAIRSY